MLDLLYAHAAGARRRWYERHREARRRLHRPVVSVGNLSVGGTGKTPLVGLIARWLIARGERPAILSRGYRRRDVEDGVVVVSDGRSLLADVHRAGDEPLMLAREAPGAIVAVCEDRHLAGVVAERCLGATVHVLDDGFQHVQLARDLDILVTSAGEIPHGRVLPFGRLREAPAAAARADFVVVFDATDDEARSEAWELGVSQYSGALGAVGPPSAAGPTGAVVVGVAGIGRPGRFFDMLERAGWDVVRRLTFPDHHRYAARDVARIAAAVRESGAGRVLTTTKDAVRFEPLQPLPFTLAPVALTLHLERWDRLAGCIEQALARAREAA